MVQRQVSAIHGKYLLGELQALEVAFTMDSGTSNKIVSPHVYQRILENVQPKEVRQLKEKVVSQLVSGEELHLTYSWDQLCIKRVLTVAEIKDEVLLGDDILWRDPQGPMDILNSEKVMIFKGEWMPLCTVGELKQQTKVLAVNTIVIPGMAEWIIDGYLEWSEEDERAEQCMLVETDLQFEQRYGCMITPAIVDVVGKTTTTVRVFNPYAEPVTVPGDVVIASMGETSVKRVLINEESPLD